MIRRLLSTLSVCVVASLTVGAVLAQPKKAPDKKAPAPGSAKTPAPTPTAGSGSAAGSAAPATPDEPPPKDMEGRTENPGNPGGVTVDVDKPKVVAPVKRKVAGYPIEEYLRPINLPANMSEVGLGPHAQLGIGSGAKYAGGDALRARYGITRQVQLGLTYLFAGIFDDPVTMTDDKIGAHGGKAVGLDLTVLLDDWIGIRVGVPLYIKPVAASLTIGVPLKFQLGEKFAIGGLDDLLNIRIAKFAPTFYQEANNAQAAFNEENSGVIQSKGALRISTFGVYQYDKKTAFIGKLGFNMEDFASTETQSDAPNGGLTYFMRAGVQYSPRKYLDIGFSLGFDDLATFGSFGPAAIFAARI
jgi:hypothetical protein